MFQKFLQWLLPTPTLALGQMTSTTFNAETGNEEKTLYSQYAQIEYGHDDRKLFVRFVCTYGLERLPEGHMYGGLDKKKYREWVRDGLVPWVGEVYFLNYAEEAIEVKPLSLRMTNERVDFDTNYEVQPKDMKITPPFILLGSNYGNEFEVEVIFEYEGQVVELKGNAQRLSVQEVKEKYSSPV